MISEPSEWKSGMPGWKRCLLGGLIGLLLTGNGITAVGGVAPALAGRNGGATSGNVFLPEESSPVRFRLFTDASPGAKGLFNTFSIEAYDEQLLPGLWREGRAHLRKGSPGDVSMDSLLVNGYGPDLTEANPVVATTFVSGPDWQYRVLDAGGAYRKLVTQYRRGILFVAPNLFVVHDHVVPREPAAFQMQLHLPAATRLDPVWGDLRLDLPRAGLTVVAPATRRQLRGWEAGKTLADVEVPGTVMFRLGQTNAVSGLDLLTVFVVHRAGAHQEIATKLLEGQGVIGARIHRDGIPTLVAFRTHDSTEKASLNGFDFNGPVGVSVFQRKSRRP